MTAWLLPEQFSDALPSESRAIESLRRTLLDTASGYGYELVIPPLLEYVDSLLSGTGQDLDLQTFKLVDQISGRTLGLRADMTPQATRIDAHLLNREGIVRLCYSGSVVHTRAQGVYATREPLQFGAEIYGHAGLEADIEVQQLAVRSLQLGGVRRMTLALSDVRIVRGVLAGMVAGPEQIDAILQALSRKDQAVLQELTRSTGGEQRDAILGLPELFGDASVLDDAARVLPDRPIIREALADLARLAATQTQAGVDVQIDLADLRGYHYHSGVIFGLYAQGQPDALARGGRYDEIGATFGRPRPATGFSLDLRELVRYMQPLAARSAIRAEWSQREGYAQAVQRLREDGQAVIELPAGATLEGEQFHFDRELAWSDGQWHVRAYSPS
ncbi:ATP phosphoribosyltransferase regulatory subunit [Thiomonas sp. FB-Cd]|uniref:ATP phosphoribosyltransferase regulatory subunit n=1 Tax=Thiomonas sp. FB-Cd TaxID=1158292 RepID=UPI0004DF9866|nr:ATP phosphoribosyltransferase regulatory subunit [Thiomonas sp. FB-Cd]